MPASGSFLPAVCEEAMVEEKDFCTKRTSDNRGRVKAACSCLKVVAKRKFYARSISTQRVLPR